MTLRRSRALLGLTAAAAATSLALAAAPGAWAAPSAQDTTFMMSNEQVNLAEITIGQLALQRASTDSARSLATQTIADHQKAKAKLTALASAEHVSLPTAPNAQQQAQAATLKSVAAPQFDATYLQIQVAGHQMSIADTDKEIANGADSSVVSYAKYYLPVATMHLNMAQADLSAVTGVPAGTGGQAAVTSSSHRQAAWWSAGAGVLLFIAAAAGLMRRRQAAH